jgi:N-alpha-acetyl-L-2,4-diaminobutyrate deacetylase
VRIALRGVRNVLRHFGVIEGTPDTSQRDGTAGTRHMMVRDPRAYTFTPAAGLFEPAHLATSEVQAGDVAGWLHFIEDVDRGPLELRYGVSGILWMASGPGRVQRGDVVAVVMRDYDAALAAA